MFDMPPSTEDNVVLLSLCHIRVAMLHTGICVSLWAVSAVWFIQQDHLLVLSPL